MIPKRKNWFLEKHARGLDRGGMLKQEAEVSVLAMEATV